MMNVAYPLAAKTDAITEQVRVLSVSSNKKDYDRKTQEICIDIGK